MGIQEVGHLHHLPRRVDEFVGFHFMPSDGGKEFGGLILHPMVASTNASHQSD